MRGPVEDSVAMETRIGHIADARTGSWTPTHKPEMFVGRHERQLGRFVGVNQFGVNHLVLEPGAFTSLRHWHAQEDEFAYVLSGEVVLIDENGEHVLQEGCFVGFPAGVPNGHQLTNRSTSPAAIIVVGARKRGEETIHYPDEDFGPVTVTRGADGERVASPPAD
jgi:uncharacterized cupin superfamily protein